jgi:hypothetical protein
MDPRDSAASDGEQANALKRALDRCDREIAKATATLLSGYPDIDGPLLGLYDWCCERRLIESEIEKEDNASGD